LGNDDPSVSPTKSWVPLKVVTMGLTADDELKSRFTNASCLYAPAPPRPRPVARIGEKWCA
jgi:hypothetical protein